MGAPADADRAVVNGAGQAVSALRASVPSASIHPDVLEVLDVQERADRAMRLLALVAGDHPVAISCDDERLDEFTDDYFGCDTCNLLFEMEWIDQIGSSDFDDFRIVLLPKGLAVTQAMSVREGQDPQGLEAKPASAVGNADAPDPSSPSTPSTEDNNTAPAAVDARASTGEA